MDTTSSESYLEIDPSVMINQNEKQQTESIDNKYGVELFTDKNQTYTLYDYDQVTDSLYANDESYSIDVNTDLIANYFTDPVVYSTETNSLDIDYQTIVSVILVTQIIVVVYFSYKIIKSRRSRNEQYNF